MSLGDLFTLPILSLSSAPADLGGYNMVGESRLANKQTLALQAQIDN